MKEQSDGMSRFREGVVVVETEKLITSAGRKLDIWPAKDELTRATFRLEKLQE